MFHLLFHLPFQLQYLPSSVFFLLGSVTPGTGMCPHIAALQPHSVSKCSRMVRGWGGGGVFLCSGVDRELLQGDTQQIARLMLILATILCCIVHNLLHDYQDKGLPTLLDVALQTSVHFSLIWPVSGDLQFTALPVFNSSHNLQSGALAMKCRSSVYCMFTYLCDRLLLPRLSSNPDRFKEKNNEREKSVGISCD